MHRKLNNMAKMTGLYPLAVLSDCVVYPSPGRSPLDFLPYSGSGKPQLGGFRLGPIPGLAKLEGVQDLAWAVELMEQDSTPPATSRAATLSWTTESRTVGEIDEAIERADREAFTREPPKTIPARIN